MPVSLVPPSAHLPPPSIEVISADDRHPFVVSNGISDTPSSMVSYNASEESETWLFEWLGGLLKSFLPSDEAPLDNRIKCGKQVLYDHFSNYFSFQADTTDFAIVVVMKYNDQILAPFGTLNKKTYLEASTQLNRLLSSDANWDCEDGKLEIKTLLFERDEECSIDVHRCGTSIRFGDGAIPSIDWDKSRYIAKADPNEELTNVVPSVEERKKVLDFINRL